LPSKLFDFLVLFSNRIQIVQAYLLRHSTLNYGEAQQFGYAVGVIVIVGGLTYFVSRFLPLEYMVWKMLLRCYGILACAMLPVAFVMIPKLLATEGVYESGTPLK
jgi:hypothetical protein